MSTKFPKASVFTTENIKKNGKIFRVAIFENGEYICQLLPKEVSSWLFKAERATKKHEEDQAYITVRRIINALEYIESRKHRLSNTENQLDLF